MEILQFTPPFCKELIKIFCALFYLYIYNVFIIKT